MSIADLQAGIQLQIHRYGYTEVDGDEIRSLPYGWLADQGWSLAHKAGTDTYVVYRPRKARAGWGDTWTWADLDRITLAQTPFSQDSVASRILNREREEHDYNAYSRPPAGRPFFVDGGTTFRLDDTVPDNSVVFVVDGQAAGRIDNLAAEPTNQTATGAIMAAHLEEASRRLNQIAYGSGDGSWHELGLSQAEHRRTAPGLCACGFTAILTSDMDAHIADEVIEGVDGVPKRWRVCERCRTSALCREVVVARIARMSFADPIPPPAGPATERVYRCDDCTRGL